MAAGNCNLVWYVNSEAQPGLREDQELLVWCRRGEGHSAAHASSSGHLSPTAVSYTPGTHPTIRTVRRTRKAATK